MKQPTQETIEPIPAPPPPNQQRDWSDYHKKIEDRIGGKLIDLPTLKRLGYDDLANSLERLGRFVNVERSLLVADKKDRVSIRFYTERNVYFISAKYGNQWRPAFEGEPLTKDCGYLGCQVTCRTPEAGEWWNRGRDLADGSYSMGTLYDILLDIIGYELEPLADWITER